MLPLSPQAFKAEKKLVANAVTSDVGKKLLREYCLPETFTLLQAMRDMASLDPLVPPKHGAKIEDTLLRLAVKIMLLYQHGRLSEHDFEPATRLVDRLAVDFVRKYDAATSPPDYIDAHDPGHEQLSTVFTALQAALRVLLTPHMSEKNVHALAEVLGYFGDPESMARFTSEPGCLAELGKMAECLRKMYLL